MGAETMLVPGLTLMRGGVDNTELASRVEGVGGKGDQTPVHVYNMYTYRKQVYI